MTLPHLWPRRTARLTLRPATPADIDQVLTWRTHPGVNRWMLSTSVDPDRYRKAWLDSVEDPLDHSVMVLLGERVVGTGSLEVSDAMGQGDRDPGVPWADAQASLGYLLDPAVHGQGLGTELMLALLSLAFDELGLHRVTAGCFADNLGSWRVMEKRGMRREQHGLQDSWHAELGWVDGYTYAILRTEWEGSDAQRVSAGWGAATNVR